MDDDPIKKLMQKREDDKSSRIVMKELIEAKKDADLKSHLSEKETLTFAKADFYAKEMGNYGFPEAESLINFFSNQLMRKRYSFMRSSRKEFGDGLKAELPIQMQEDRNKIERMIK